MHKITLKERRSINLLLEKNINKIPRYKISCKETVRNLISFDTTQIFNHNVHTFKFFALAPTNSTSDRGR